MKKSIILGMFALTVLTFGGCKKAEDGAPGAQGPQGVPGPDAQTFTYTLTFTSSDTYQTYSGITGYDANDVIVTYVLNDTYAGEEYYVQTPYVVAGYVNIFAEVGANTGQIFINTEKADGTTGSPWTAAATFKFKSVLIKSRAVKAHPEVNYSDYNQVKNVFNIK